MYVLHVENVNINVHFSSARVAETIAIGLLEY